MKNLKRKKLKAERYSKKVDRALYLAAKWLEKERIAINDYKKALVEVIEDDNS